MVRARDAKRSMIEYKSRESFRKSERLQRIALISYINVLEHLQRIQNYRTWKWNLANLINSPKSPKLDAGKNHTLMKTIGPWTVARPKAVNQSEIKISISFWNSHKQVRPSIHSYTKTSLFDINLRFNYWTVLKSDFRFK